jgi:hypothetical protein
MLDSKLHFHRYIHYFPFQALKLLRLTRFITYNFPSLGSLMFYILPWFLQCLSKRLSLTIAAYPRQRSLRFETSLFVTSYDSQDYGGGIRLRLQTGAAYNPSARTNRKHSSSIVACADVAGLSQQRPLSAESPLSNASIRHVILLCSPLNDDFIHGSSSSLSSSSYYYYMNCLILYFVCKFSVVSFYVLVLTS